MSAEIRRIAAEVSWQQLAERDHHRVYSRVADGYEVVKIETGAPTVENTFLDLPADVSDIEKRNIFWKLQRSKYGQDSAYHVLDVCVRLNKRGVRLMHEGVTVTNFFLMNGCIGVSGLEDIRLSAKDPKTGQLCKVDLYSTLRNEKVMAGFSGAVRMLLDMGPFDRDESNNRKIADLLKINLDDLIPHWWCCFVLENQTMIHVDLSGPAYDLFHYESLSGRGEAPVYIVELPELCVNQFPPDIEKLFPHKLMMLRSCASSMVPVVPKEFLPFQAVEKINLELTPVDKMYEVSKKKFQLTSLHDAVVDSVILDMVRQSASSGNKIVANVSGIASRPDLNGKSFRVTHVTPSGRVVVQLSSSEKVTMSPSKLSFDECPNKMQYRTLTEMKEAYAKMISAAEVEMEERLQPNDTVLIEGLKKKDLNGQSGVLVELVSAVGDRWLVQLETGERKSIAQKNLKRVAKRVPTLDEAFLEKEIQNILLRDPKGQDFYQRVFVTSNLGLTNLTDPELLPTFKKLVKLKFGEIYLKSPPQQRQWEVLVKLTEHRDFPGFRAVLQQFRTGLSPDQFINIMEQNPSYHVMYEICVKEGMLKMRTP